MTNLSQPLRWAVVTLALALQVAPAAAQLNAAEVRTIHQQAVAAFQACRYPAAHGRMVALANA